MTQMRTLVQYDQRSWAYCFRHDTSSHNQFCCPESICDICYQKGHLKDICNQYSQHDDSDKTIYEFSKEFSSVDDENNDDTCFSLSFKEIYQEINDILELDKQDEDIIEIIDNDYDNSDEILDYIEAYDHQDQVIQDRNAFREPTIQSSRAQNNITISDSVYLDRTQSLDARIQAQRTSTDLRNQAQRTSRDPRNQTQRTSRDPRIQANRTSRDPRLQSTDQTNNSIYVNQNLQAKSISINTNLQIENQSLSREDMIIEEFQNSLQNSGIENFPFDNGSIQSIIGNLRVSKSQESHYYLVDIQMKLCTDCSYFHSISLMDISKKSFRHLTNPSKFDSQDLIHEFLNILQENKIGINILVFPSVRTAFNQLKSVVRKIKSFENLFYQVINYVVDLEEEILNNKKWKFSKANPQILPLEASHLEAEDKLQFIIEEFDIEKISRLEKIPSRVSVNTNAFELKTKIKALKPFESKDFIRPLPKIEQPFQLFVPYGKIKNQIKVLRVQIIDENITVTVQNTSTSDLNVDCSGLAVFYFSENEYYRSKNILACSFSEEQSFSSTQQCQEYCKDFIDANYYEVLKRKASPQINQVDSKRRRLDNSIPLCNHIKYELCKDYFTKFQIDRACRFQGNHGKYLHILPTDWNIDFCMDKVIHEVCTCTNDTDSKHENSDFSSIEDQVSKMVKKIMNNCLNCSRQSQVQIKQEPIDLDTKVNIQLTPSVDIAPHIKTELDKPYNRICNHFDHIQFCPTMDKKGACNQRKCKNRKMFHTPPNPNDICWDFFNDSKCNCKNYEKPYHMTIEQFKAELEIKRREAEKKCELCKAPGQIKNQTKFVKNNPNICINFAKKGKCWNGNSCKYLHEK